MEISFACDCGQVTGKVDPKFTKGTRAICLCDDCQAYAHSLGRAKDMLDANGGTDVYPMTPAQMRFEFGESQMRVMRLGPKGIFRWYADCCKTPIGNSPPAAKIAYIGLMHNCLENKNDRAMLANAFGPITARIQGKFGIGKLPPGTFQKASGAFLFRAVKLMVTGLIRGLDQPHPFFTTTGEPKQVPRILTRDEREALRKFCGPVPQA